MRNKSYIEFSKIQLHNGYNYMCSQVDTAPIEYQSLLKEVLDYYWQKFLNNGFKVDGATFIDEEDGHFFNIWWFIHDGRNSEGYVGKKIDQEMISIMTLVDVPPKHFMQAVPFLNLTFVNVIIHKVMFNYKRQLPGNLILIK